MLEMTEADSACADMHSWLQGFAVSELCVEAGMHATRAGHTVLAVAT